ncbi:Detected protein of confused Function [Hibiscus syriacus]|uniref:DNA topoisomerase 2 n=1 Tax=Hibiscus syriacus TaxID=106335 RepID=A0A6A2YFK9_HIBSY|nr:Detected protein of confused Function [Hibiscus syriacus]
MRLRTQPIIEECGEEENWTRITFKPDLAKFNMIELESDMIALMKKRIFDLAACLGGNVEVKFNRQSLENSFIKYVDYYLKAVSKTEAEPLLSLHEKVDNGRWEVCVSFSEGQFQQISFVNGISTTKGGTHVDHVTDLISKYVMESINKKKRKKKNHVKVADVKNNMWVFVNALIDNPTFDSQTKETLTLDQSKFGSICELSEDFLEKVYVEIDELVRFGKDIKQLGRSSRILNIPKLSDAAEAGGVNSELCTLILTEGDSAKSLVEVGLNVVEKKYYGVYPLRGKIRNASTTTIDELMKNTELKNIKRILGLELGKEYENVDTLRYGHVMIMTDQDLNGSHIKGLLINFFHSCWPSLLKIESFLQCFITPIIKVTNNEENRVEYFDSLHEYEEWRKSMGLKVKEWSINYIKGLGSSTKEEGEKILWRNRKSFESVYMGRCRRPEGIGAGIYYQLDLSVKKISYARFIKEEFVHFSMLDNKRSIASVFDGFKTTQRKIIFCSFKKNLTEAIKVSEFSGYVSEHSRYRHGVQSIHGTIISMAKDFVGSNNINLLMPSGIFGTHDEGGKDAAKPRYLSVQLAPITRYLFPEVDDSLLDYLEVDDRLVEPRWYVPILPLVLVNGSEGIGTGWSSFVPKYDPREIVTNLKLLLDNKVTFESMVPMKPWYKGFGGEIDEVPTSNSSYIISGVIETEETTVRITELPVGLSADMYKKTLDSILSKEDSFEKYECKQCNGKIIFEVIMKEKMADDVLLEKLKLTTKVNTSNMHLFDGEGNIKKYNSIEEILAGFYRTRLDLYVKRKKAMEDALEQQISEKEIKLKFIRHIAERKIDVHRKKPHVLADLRKAFPEATERDYDFLLSVTITDQLLEKFNELYVFWFKFSVPLKIDNDFHSVQLEKAPPDGCGGRDTTAAEDTLINQDSEGVELPPANRRSTQELNTGSYCISIRCSETKSARVLEINMVTFPNVADAILANGMFSHYDCKLVCMYEKTMEDALEQQISEKEIKLKFIRHIAERKIDVHRKKPHVLADLRKAFPEATERDYDFLLSVTITDQLLEKFNELCSEKDKLEKQLIELKGSTARSLWRKELDEFLTELAKQYKAYQEAQVRGKLEKAPPHGCGGRNTRAAEETLINQDSEGVELPPANRRPTRTRKPVIYKDHMIFMVIVVDNTSGKKALRQRREL